MTTAPIKPTSPFPARSQAAAAGPAAPSVDIGKMFKKYLWLLIASVIVGVLLGIGSFVVLRQVYPIFQSQVIFQVLPPQIDLDIQVAKDEDEQERFALTQVAQMKSDDVIQRVVSDPRLQAQGGDWAKKFMSGGTFQSADAAEWLQDNLVARLVPNTDIIEMKLGWKKPADITNVLGLVRELYMFRLDEQSRLQTAPQREALATQITNYQKRLEDKQRLREQILRDDKVDSLEQRWAAENLELQAIIGTLHQIRISKEAAGTQLARYEAELNAQGGPTFSDELRNAVEAEPIIQNIHQNIASFDAQKASMQRIGIGPEHRAMTNMNALIESWRVKLDEERERLLRKRFDAIVDGMRSTISTLNAQETEMAAVQERLVTRLVDLSRTMTKVDDFDREIEGILKTKAEMEAKLQTLTSVGGLATSKRVLVLQKERNPDRPIFPNILYMIPAGVVLCLGLTTGIVFLRELLDQRVKGLADITMIPRTRVLGLVPDASEDSATPRDQMHRAFSAAPRGVVSESFRQIRSPLLKQMDLADHKSLMVMSGMPGSGASTVAANLAAAAAASGRRTLIIDANFRRPSQHTGFGVGEAPGLSDVLAGNTTIEQAAVPTQTEKLSLLPAGSSASRVIEQLAGHQFAEVLTAATNDYDLVVIDVPPAIVSGDGVSIANRCDASMLVVKAYNEKRGLVARIRNQLADSKAEFLGVVVNGVRASAGGYLRGNIRASQSYAGDN
jgi:capsular exopolysaccharide synthesis family protein